MPEKIKRRKRRKPEEMPERRETYAVSIDEDTHRLSGLLAEMDATSRKGLVNRLILEEAKFRGVE